MKKEFQKKFLQIFWQTFQRKNGFVFQDHDNFYVRVTQNDLWQLHFDDIELSQLKITTFKTYISQINKVLKANNLNYWNMFMYQFKGENQPKIEAFLKANS